MGVCVR
ncbi:unnamed protein product, partial [Onchocerca ochengi]